MGSPDSLVQIQQAVDKRVRSLESARPSWPCHKGCDHCCRHLASEPLICDAEWRLIAAALDDLDPPTAASAKQRMRASAGKPKPVTCPLLDEDSGACLVYAARPIACRAYGYYAEREGVLGCHHIHHLAATETTLVWGNHEAIQANLSQLGQQRPLSQWAAELPLE